MRSDKHIVFLTPGFAADEADTTCTPYLQAYFRALQAARPGLRISVLAMHYPFRRGQYDWHGIRVTALGGRNRRWAKPLLWRRTQLQLLALHRQHPVGAIHAYWLGEAAQSALRFAKLVGIRPVASFMGQDVLPTNAYLRRLDLGRLVTTAPSPYSAAKLKEACGHEADAIVPFGLSPADADASAPADRPIDVLGVGSLIPVKRWDRFLRVVNQLREAHPQVRATLVGEGPEGPRLRAMAAEVGLAPHIEWLGNLPRPEVLALMSKAKVFLHTSDIEGTGLVMLEALARGCHLATMPVGIAAEGEKWRIGGHTQELVPAVDHWLRHPVDWLPRLPHTTDDMVAQLLPLYGL